MRPRHYRKVKRTFWVLNVSAVTDNPNNQWFEQSQHLRNERQIYASRELAMQYKREGEKHFKGASAIIQVKPITFDVYESYVR